jgi:hypothetical protein
MLVTGIKWETDGKPVEGLPDSEAVILWQDYEPEIEVALVLEELSDKYGWLILDCVIAEDTQWIKAQDPMWIEANTVRSIVNRGLWR